MNNTSKLKIADLTSSIGAGVLGLGLGAYFSDNLKLFSIPIIAVGFVSHVFGMFDKHRIENKGTMFQPVWTKLTYAVCWIGIVSLIIFLIYFRPGIS